MALLLLSVGNVLGHGDGVVALVVFAGVVYLFFRGRRDSTGELAEPVAAPPLVRPAVPAAMAPLPELPEPRVKRPRSVLGTLTTGTALLVSSTLVLLNATDVADIRAEVILAAALLVVGAGIVASAWWGRSLILIPVAIVLGLSLAATSVARPAIDAGVGEREWSPTGSATYRLGVGEAILDLRDVDVREGTAHADHGEGRRRPPDRPGPERPSSGAARRSRVGRDSSSTAADPTAGTSTTTRTSVPRDRRRSGSTPASAPARSRCVVAELPPTASTERHEFQLGSLIIGLLVIAVACCSSSDDQGVTTSTRPWRPAASWWSG